MGRGLSILAVTGLLAVVAIAARNARLGGFVLVIIVITAAVITPTVLTGWPPEGRIIGAV